MNTCFCIVHGAHLVYYCLQDKVICRCIHLSDNLQVYTASRIKTQSYFHSTYLFFPAASIECGNKDMNHYKHEAEYKIS